MEEVLLARQSIYNARLDVIAYELLFRNSEQNNADILQGSDAQISADEATERVILNTFLDVGLDKVVGSVPAFINFTRNLLLNPVKSVLRPERIVIEVLEDVLVDQELIEALYSLSRSGYRIALDDFVYRPELEPLLEIADIVKVDVLQEDQYSLRKLTERFEKHDLKLLAEKVETYEQFAFCRAIGFDYFQGYFLSQPNLIRGQQYAASRLMTLQLLGDFLQENLEQEEFLSILGRETQIANSVKQILQLSRGSAVECFEDAIEEHGLAWVSSLATLMTIDTIKEKPEELMVATMARARMCAIIAKAHKLPNETEFFKLGILSALDAWLDAEMSNVLSSLPIKDKLKKAVLYHEGQMGELLASVLAYERAQWHQVDYSTLAVEEYRLAYLESIGWAESLCRL